MVGREGRAVVSIAVCAHRLNCCHTCCRHNRQQQNPNEAAHASSRRNSFQPESSLLSCHWQRSAHGLADRKWCRTRRHVFGVGWLVVSSGLLLCFVVGWLCGVLLWLVLVVFLFPHVYNTLCIWASHPACTAMAQQRVK